MAPAPTTDPTTAPTRPSGPNGHLDDAQPPDARRHPSGMPIRRMLWDDRHHRGGRLSAPWRQVVLRRCHALAMALVELEAPDDEQTAATIDGMWTMLDEAHVVATEARSSAVTWWSGTEPERAWRCLRETEERLVDVVPADDLEALAAQAVDHAAAYDLSADREDLRHLQALRLARASQPPPVDASPAERDGGSRGDRACRAAIRAVLTSAHARADRVNRDARALRNRLLLASVLTLLGAAGLLAVQAHLFRSTEVVTAPSGWTASPWMLLAAVMAVGAIGALFTAIPALSRVPSDASPSNLPLQQSLLKVAFGPVTAVAGLAALSAAPAVTGIELQVGELSSSTLFLLALVFGAGQQSVTRFVDRRASSILEEADATTPSPGA